MGKLRRHNYATISVLVPPSLPLRWSLLRSPESVCLTLPSSAAALKWTKRSVINDLQWIIWATAVIHQAQQAGPLGFTILHRVCSKTLDTSGTNAPYKSDQSSYIELKALYKMPHGKLCEHINICNNVSYSEPQDGKM